MAKNSMKLKYKTKKRERNKNISNSENPTKSFFLTLIGVIVFIGVIYLCILGLEKLGVFEEGYTAPTKESTSIDYEYIPIGTILNRYEKNYYVLFDNYKTSITEDTYINDLLSDQDDYAVYKVDMSKNENSKYSSTEENKNAKKVEDLKINGITLIKVSNGKIVAYISGSDNIEEYLTK